jgi:Domain of unknown function (DUF4412)
MKLKLIIFPLCLVVLNAFGFEGTIKQTVKNYNGSGNDVTVTWYLSQQHCRMDVAAIGYKGANTNTVFIMDPASKSMKMYENANAGNGQKLYFQADAGSITGGVSVISVSPTQETRQISGFRCEKWVVATSNGSFNLWVTKDIDFDWTAYKDFFKASVEVQALINQGVKGFVMATEPVSGTSGVTTVESASSHALASDTFTVPSEYKLNVAPATQPAKGK